MGGLFNELKLYVRRQSLAEASGESEQWRDHVLTEDEAVDGAAELGCEPDDLLYRVGIVVVGEEVSAWQAGVSHGRLPS